MADLNLVSYPEKVIRWIPLPYWLSLILLWESLFMVDYITGQSIAEAHLHLAEYGCLVLFFALVSVTIVYCSRVLSALYEDIRLFIAHDEGELRQWYTARLRFSYQGIWPLLFATLFTLVVNLTAADTMLQFTPTGTTSYLLRSGYIYLGFFALGLGIWALVNVLLIPIGLTRYKIRVNVTQVSGKGLQALGSSFFRMSLAITASFIPLVVAAIISPLITDLTILIWLGAGTLSIFGFFLLPQIGIHRIMSQEKRQRLLSFSNHLEEAMERSLKEPTPQNIQRLKELFELQEHLKNMNAWPFNVHTVWQLITALLIPIVLAIVEIFFSG